MTSLTSVDLHFVMSRLPKDVRNLMKADGIILGGGFIRSTISGEKVNDIDLFGDTKERLKTLAFKLSSKRNGRVHETPNAFTVLSPPRLMVQFINRWLFSNPAEVVNSFDFTICMAAIWYDKESKKFFSVIHENFYPDLAAKRMVYTFPIRNEDVGGSILRVRKFLMKGYTIQAPNLAGVMARLFKALDHNKLDLSDERQVSKVLCGLLREVDPAVVVDGVEVVDEHEAIDGTD